MPMIGWMPFSSMASENSSAPKRLPVSVMASAGIAHVVGEPRHLLDGQGAFGQRIGRMGAQMDEGHAGRLRLC